MTRVKCAGAVLALVVSLPLLANAEDAKGPHHTVNPMQAITKDPGGSKLGDLFINTPVEVKEVKGDWAFVKMEGWVRMNSLAPGGPASAASVAQAMSYLEIARYTIKPVTDGVPAPRVYVTLTLKNKGSTPIQSWEALLVGQSKSGGQVLFREPISDSVKPIQAGGEVDVSFYWVEQEGPYDSLKNATPETLTLILYKVVVK